MHVTREQPMSHGSTVDITGAAEITREQPGCINSPRVVYPIISGRGIDARRTVDVK